MNVWNASKKEKLTPCPFCGSTRLSIIEDENVHMSDRTNGHHVLCDHCGGRSGVESYEGCIYNWNRRAYEAPKSAIDAPVVKLGDRPE